MSPEKTTEGPKRTSNPVSFVHSFLESEMVLFELNRYSQERGTLQSGSKEDQMLTFLRTPLAEELVIDHAAMNMGLSYEPSHYSPDAQEAIASYLSLNDEIRQTVKQGIAEDDDFHYLDSRKKITHNRAAQQLVDDGIVPTHSMGRGLISLFLREHNSRI